MTNPTQKHPAPHAAPPQQPVEDVKAFGDQLQGLLALAEGYAVSGADELERQVTLSVAIGDCAAVVAQANHRAASMLLNALTIARDRDAPAKTRAEIIGSEIERGLRFGPNN